MPSTTSNTYMERSIKYTAANSRGKNYPRKKMTCIPVGLDLSQTTQGELIFGKQLHMRYVQDHNTCSKESVEGISYINYHDCK